MSLVKDLLNFQMTILQLHCYVLLKKCEKNNWVHVYNFTKSITPMHHSNEKKVRYILGLCVLLSIKCGFNFASVKLRYLKTNESPHEKTKNVVYQKVRHKSSCTSTEDGFMLEFSDLVSRQTVLFVQRNKGADLRLCFRI